MMKVLRVPPSNPLVWQLSLTGEQGCLALAKCSVLPCCLPSVVLVEVLRSCVPSIVIA